MLDTSKLTAFPVKVSVITPTTHERASFNRQIREIISAQDYPNIEHLFNYEDLPIGTKRNLLCRQATGDIIVHADSDDIYATDWVRRSVESLAASKGNVTGLSSAYFKQGDQYYLWKWKATQPYVCEATMCYKRAHALSNPFHDVMTAEGLAFCGSSIVRPHGYVHGFTAIIHGGNISSHKSLIHMEKITPVL